MIENLKNRRITKRQERYQLAEEKLKVAYGRAVEDFLDKGLLGEHELQVLPPLSTQTTGAISGRISGSLFSFRGSIEGAVESQPSVRFAWVTNNKKQQLVISELPADKFVIQLDEEKQRPTVQFELNTPNFMQLRPDEKSPVGFEISTTSYPHPNDYLKGNNLRVARIDLSNEDFQKVRTFSSSSQGLLTE